MSGYAELIKLIKNQQEELRIRQLLDSKNYSNILVEDFGLNKWTNRLIKWRIGNHDETQQPEISKPDHLVSFLSIPVGWQEESISTNSDDLKQWFSGYQWPEIPGTNDPFPQKRIQACSEGLLLPQWIETPYEGWLEAFLILQRDGVCEYGIGRKAYFHFEKDTIFQLIQIIGQLWHFLLFVKYLYDLYLPHKNQDVLVLVNIRGTENALMGNLATGWKEPFSRSFDTYRPKCYDRHLQIRRKIGPDLLSNKVEGLVQWFATRIENAWGQFEPRCYVHQNINDSKPFAHQGPK
jgi:hypothetical protein